MRLDHHTVGSDDGSDVECIGGEWRGRVDREATYDYREPEFARILKIPDLILLKD